MPVSAIPRVKICGITRIEDALHACRAGADALGFVFYENSPRHVDIHRAAAILDGLPPFVTSVGLFVDAPEARVREVLDAVPLDLLQFHGTESPGYCAAFDRPWIKALRVRPGLDLLQSASLFSGARALLLDAYVPGTPGGTGQRFDWNLIPDDLPLPVVLSGGLDPDNVADAVRRVRPWAVDVSSGVEAIDAKGIKDSDRVTRFIANAKHAHD